MNRDLKMRNKRISLWFCSTGDYYKSGELSEHAKALFILPSSVFHCRTDTDFFFAFVYTITVYGGVQIP